MFITREPCCRARRLLKYWYCSRAKALRRLIVLPDSQPRRQWEIAKELPINAFIRSKIDASVAELKEEKLLVAELFRN
jgi:hypothetical protein